MVLKLLGGVYDAGQGGWNVPSAVVNNYNASILSQLLFAQNVYMYVLCISIYESVNVCFGMCLCMHMHL